MFVSHDPRLAARRRMTPTSKAVRNIQVLADPLAKQDADYAPVCILSHVQASPTAGPKCVSASVRHVPAAEPFADLGLPVVVVHDRE